MFYFPFDPWVILEVCYRVSKHLGDFLAIFLSLNFTVVSDYTVNDFKCIWNLVLYIDGTSNQLRENGLSKINSSGTARWGHGKKRILVIDFIPYNKGNSRWIMDFSIKTKAIIILEEHKRKFF